jgi:nucleoid-associated protein YgaU
MSSLPMIGTSTRRSALVTVAALAGAGASLSLFALTNGATPLPDTLVNQAGTTLPLAAVAPVIAPAPAPAPAAAPAAAPVARVAAPKAAPAAKAAAAPAPHAMAVPAASCTGAKPASDAFLQHLQAAHLATSPLQQVTDAADVDAYTQAHTVLIGNMLMPLVGGAEGTLDAFLQHVYAAHLGESPTEQVADAANVDQYVKTHTVMAENMITPLVGC